MRLVAFFVVNLLFWSSGLGQGLEVTIVGIENDKGEILLGLFSNEKDFLKHPVRGEKYKSAPGTIKVTLQGVTSGTYALSVVHDANTNGRIDTNFVGIPKEGFGFSNDAMGLMGPPGFQKASFHWTGKESVVIHLRYF